ncbi:MAG: AAA family ATPase [Legionella sp.]|uniref:AAA family ATPase n=1 Tax=Legionella sp. TaxID=459 RepID=UPI0039E510FA
MSELDRAFLALSALDSGCPHDEWIRIGMAAKAAGLSFEDFHSWSKSTSNYVSEKDCHVTWKSFDQTGGVTEATLFFKAKEAGWKNSNPSFNQKTYQPKLESNITNVAPYESSYALEIWERCLPADNEHPYISRKEGQSDGLKVYPENVPSLIIQTHNVSGYLVVPCISNGKIKTLQFIPPDEGKKLNLGGAQFHDGYFVIGQITTCIYLCEGLSAAWPVNKVLGVATVISFGVSRMMTVAKKLRSQYPFAKIVIVPDRGQEELASKITLEINATWIELPQEIPLKQDVGDYAQKYGYEKLNLILTSPKTPSLPLNTIFADTLPEAFSPVDELLEGILIEGDGSILYGDSNSGKTFFVIDMACAIARGIDWMGRKTEQGLVIYLAAESPSSVKRRLQTYQMHHQVRIRNFAIVQNPINLFDNDSDTSAIINLVQLIEEKYQQKVRLIIGDTLARLSSGANENAGQDMGVVIRHFDRIRNECNVHFMLIHHSGKSAAAGARGWSGVRAAVDTEIEITDSPTGRCAEITKQRDLSTKGTRIGFQLEIVTMRLSKWKSVVTGCVVIPTDAPIKNPNKRVSEIGRVLTKYISTLDRPIKKSDLVKHFKDQYKPPSIYRELKKLVEARLASDSMGIINKVPIGAY